VYAATPHCLIKISVLNCVWHPFFAYMKFTLSLQEKTGVNNNKETTDLQLDVVF
jgi:hypothetical protein